MTLQGVLIAESLRLDLPLKGPSLMITAMKRVEAPGAVPAGQPTCWTLIDFEAPDEAAVPLAAALERVLDERDGWYCDFRSESETFVVFAGRTFRYARGDRAGRDAAAEYARSLGVPEAELDWPV